MARRFLAETDSAGFRALVVGHHQVHDSWDQVQSFLSARLSPAHAAVFAEPLRGRSTLSWMASSDSEPVLLADLPEAQRGVVQQRLSELLADIGTLADELGASRDAQQNQWAALLREIQRLPGARDVAQNIYVGDDGQPIMILWGTRDENSVEARALLTERLEQRPQTVMRAAPKPDPALMSSAPVAPGAMGAWPYWVWLLWLLFILLLAAILYVLLRACDTGFPGGPGWFSRCGGPAPVLAAAQERERLSTEYERLQAQAGQAPQCSLQQAEIRPTPAPAVPQLPPEPNTRQPGVPENETDIDRARRSAGGQMGDVTVTLSWSNQSDLDLLIKCPDGKSVPKSGNRGNLCGGRIDIDANLCIQRQGGRSGGACQKYRGTPTSSPVENGFFFERGAQSGQYQVQVRHFADIAPASGAPVPFGIQIRKGVAVETFDGRAEPGSTVTITTFNILN